MEARAARAESHCEGRVGALSYEHEKTGPTGNRVGSAGDGREGGGRGFYQGGGEGRGKNPYRVSIRSPMFITIPYVAKTMIGYKIADIPAIMGSFDPCIGETDR